ncbi:hypothetical protein GW17_00017086 [Ensete ventricosum]|nr:hypothetical protein GW17_00017086 [Ensete ventricosum]
MVNNNRGSGVYCKRAASVEETASFVQLGSSRRALVARGGEISTSSKGSRWSFSSRWVQIDDICRAATAAWPTLLRKVYSIGHKQPRRADPTAESRMKAPNLEIKTGREPMAIGPTGEELPWSGNLVKITSDHCKGEKDR